MQHFISLHGLFKVKMIFREKTHFFLIYNLTPINMYNGLSQVYCIKQEEEPISQPVQKFRNTV